MARDLWRAAIVLAAVASAPACDGYIRSDDPLEAHPDVVSVAILLVAGESEARLLAIHPHRPWRGAPPRIAATLEGPGWTVAFSGATEIESCARVLDLLGPAVCRSAELPEPIRPDTQYRIAGTAPLGSFHGEMVVPAAPLLVAPADTVRLAPPANNSVVEIATRYEADAGIGTLLAEALDVIWTEGDGSETEGDLGSFPQPLDGTARADTVVVFYYDYYDTPIRFSMRLLGLGWEYTHFLAQRGSFPVPRPWPAFGIEGEGVYGYFAGAAASRAVQVQITPRAQGAGAAASRGPPP